MPGERGRRRAASLATVAAPFNESTFRRTAAATARSPGTPRVSLIHLSGPRPEVVVTVAWDISWYQYRVVFDSTQPVRLAESGYERDSLDAQLTAWNASLDHELCISVLAGGPDFPADQPVVPSERVPVGS